MWHGRAARAFLKTRLCRWRVAGARKNPPRQMRDAARRTGSPRLAVRATPAGPVLRTNSWQKTSIFVRCVRLQRWQVVAAGRLGVQRCGGAGVRSRCRRCVARGAAARPGRQSLVAGDRRGSLSPTRYALCIADCARDTATRYMTGCVASVIPLKRPTITYYALFIHHITNSYETR